MGGGVNILYRILTVSYYQIDKSGSAEKQKCLNIKLDSGVPLYNI